MSRGFSHLVAAAVPLLWLAVVAPSQEGALAIGNGSTSQAPIVIAGTSNIIEGIAAEARWISQRYAEERVRSVTIGRAKINMAAVTEVGLVSKDARQRRIYFVIDESSFKHSGIDILWKSYVHAIRDATDSTLLGAYSKQIRQALRKEATPKLSLPFMINQLDNKTELPLKKGGYLDVPEQALRISDLAVDFIVESLGSKKTSGPMFAKYVGSTFGTYHPKVNDYNQAINDIKEWWEHAGPAELSSDELRWCNGKE